MSVDGDMGTGARRTHKSSNLRRLMGALVIANVTGELILHAAVGMDRRSIMLITPSLVSWGSELSTVDPSCPKQQFGARISTGQNRESVCV